MQKRWRQQSLKSIGSQTRVASLKMPELFSFGTLKIIPVDRITQVFLCVEKEVLWYRPTSFICHIFQSSLANLRSEK